MGSSSGLVDRLDFNTGLQFQDEVRRIFKSPVHHPLPSSNGSFLLLVTFRRFLFRLTEESVALALQSCLGGRAECFHVKFLSNNHFRFSVFSKEVGFYVYKLRRVIGPSFDCFFHLWSNGAPHWEREKLAWEIEQQKLWTEVRRKKPKTFKPKSTKKVSFAKNLVSFPEDFSPGRSAPPLIQFGAFSSSIDLPVKMIFGNRKLLDCSNVHHVPRNEPCTVGSLKDSGIPGGSVGSGSISRAQNSNLNPKDAYLGPACFICLSPKHPPRLCPSNLQCGNCNFLGHSKSLCSARSDSWWWKRKPSGLNKETTVDGIGPDSFGNLDSRAKGPVVSTSPIPPQKQSCPSKSHPLQDTPPPPPPPSPNEENPNHPPASPPYSPSPSSPDPEAAMANFPVNPRPFLVSNLQVEDGWNRPARAHLALGGEPPREHEDYAIVSIEPMNLQDDELRPTLNFVCQFLQEEHRVQVIASHLSPLGLGLIRLRTVAQRDQLVRESPYNLGQNMIVRVVKHDEGINHRSCTYGRICWIMFLAFPLDFQKDLYVQAAVAPYGRLLDWYHDTNKSRILAQVLLLSPNRVPRSLIVSRGTLIGGMGRSWAVPVFILNGHFPDAFPADEDPVPLDGEPHPEHGPLVMGPNPLEPNWQAEQQGAAQNLGAFGGNPHPNPQHMQHHAPIVNEPVQANDDVAIVEDINDDDEDEWPAWNPAPLPVLAPQVPQHPEVPQDFVDLELSGSSMRFLIGQGPDISLDHVMTLSDNSSSSSDASSAEVQSRARFIAARARSAQVLIFGRKELPDTFFRASSSQLLPDGPIVIPNLDFPQEPTGLEIVPWQLVLDAIALQIWPMVVDCLHSGKRRKTDQLQNMQPITLSLLLYQILCSLSCFVLLVTCIKLWFLVLVKTS
ncbi:hypothetical protein BS78_K154700 [Paspalum vaginatum]|uniref:DUF7597 domain-containing protein n=1 Tax=Paspalum vaginatum TaxID=158149 RepID=A0A9W7X9G5_9POAL|nr:hypothetical protein BS78_K154700 [Paspalum vaginatum]